MAIKKKDETQVITSVDTEEWYTAGVAANVLTINSKREVRADYVTKLGKLEKIRVKKIHARLTLYNKADVDAYRVEDRGTKSGEAKKALAARKKPIAT